MGRLIDHDAVERRAQGLPLSEEVEAREQPAPAGTFREICAACNRPSPIGFHVPDVIWLSCVPLRFRSKLCLQCFARFADEAGVAWDREIQMFPISLVTHREASLYDTDCDPGDESDNF